MPSKGTKNGDRVSQPQAFAVFISKDGRVGVRVGSKRAYTTVDEVTITAGYEHVTAKDGGLLIQGRGVVRQHRNVVAITA